MKILILLLSFVASLTAISLECSFFNYGWGTGTAYTCSTNQCIFDDSQLLMNVTGVHLANYTNGDVKVVIFLSVCQTLDFIPRGMELFFPTLIGLHFQYTNISTLSGDELYEHENLEWLVLADQRITHIPGNFLSHNPRIQDLWFDVNRISSVGEDFLTSLENANTVIFEGNVCINMNANSPSQIPALIDSLRVNCAETTSTSTTEASTEEPTCDLNETICELKLQNKVLMQKMETMMEMILELSTRPCGL